MSIKRSGPGAYEAWRADSSPCLEEPQHTLEAEPHMERLGFSSGRIRNRDRAGEPWRWTMSIRFRLLLSSAHEYVQQQAGLSGSIGSRQTVRQLKPQSAIDRLQGQRRKGVFQPDCSNSRAPIVPRPSQVSDCSSILAAEVSLQRSRWAFRLLPLTHCL